jgi:Flp pilus assembly protein TadD
MKGLTPLEYARSQPGVLLHYLHLSVWPDHLCFDYGWPIARDATSILLAGAVVILMLLATAWALCRCPPLGFVGVWFFLVLVPTSSIMPINDLAVEHRMYLPLIAVLTLAVVGGYTLLPYISGWRALTARSWAGLAGGVVVCVALLLSWRTIVRNDEYCDWVAIWSSVLAQRPDNPRGYANLAVAHTNHGIDLMLAGKYVAAEREFRTALDLKPGLVEAHVNFGALLASLGRTKEAREQFDSAVRDNPRAPEAHFNLGLFLTRQGNIEEGMRHLDKVLQLKPNHAKAQYNLGISLAKQAKFPEAEGHLRTAVKLDPGHAASHFCLAGCLASEGRIDEARQEFGIAARLDPKYPIPDLATLSPGVATPAPER